MVTPVTARGQLDEPAVDRLVGFLLAGGVDGVFVLGTTGEGVSVPRAFRRRLVECAVQRAKGRARIYAGIGDLYPHDAAAGNEYLEAGADVIVARPPIGFAPEKLLPWFQSLLAELQGPLMMYNMPSTTNVSIPLEMVEQLAAQSKLVGIKDSENNPKRLDELLRRFSGRAGFAVFVGVGRLMARGLKLGAKGIVPSVGNLVPDICARLCACARDGQWPEAELHAGRMNEVAALYQQGRTLSQSLAALKGAMSWRGLCEPHVLPPLLPLSAAELETIRGSMKQLKLLE